MTTEELLNLILDHRLRELHTALPGRVESYDASKQTCDVLPMLKKQTPNGQGGYTTEDLPVLPNVPVAFPRGGGGFFMSFPLSKGDFVMLVFHERAIGAWRKKGEATAPGDLRMHSLAGAVAYPGLYPNDDALDDASDSLMVLGKDGADGQIAIAASEIKVGKNATKKAARQNDGVGNGTLAFTFGAGTGAATLAITYTPGDGSAPQSIPTGSGTITIKEKITGGSNKVKVID